MAGAMTKLYSTVGCCPEHGIFPAGIEFPAGLKLQIKNLGAICPKCGVTAEMIPGDYDVINDRLNIVVDASISRATLEALGLIAERLRREEITLEEAEDYATKLSPKLRGLFSGLSTDNKIQIAMGVLTVVGSLLGAKLAGGDTIVNNYPPAITETVGSIPSPAAPVWGFLPKEGPIPKPNPRMESLKNNTALFRVPIPTPKPRQ